MEEMDEMLTAKQAAGYLKDAYGVEYHPNTIKGWMDVGRLDYAQPGGPCSTRLVRRGDLDRIMSPVSAVQ
jgi:hypothetical protein